MPEISGQSIVCFSNIEWGIWKQRHHHMMERFARRNRVVFVETLGMRAPNLLSPSDLRRIGGRLARAMTGTLRSRGRSGGPSQRPQSLTVYSPLVVPFHSSTPVRRLNARLLLRDLGRLLAGGPDPILWVYLPLELILDVASRLSHRLLVYDCVDEITEFQDAPAGLVESERRLIRRADVVFASARLLEDKCGALNPSVHYVPNAADVELFARASDAPAPDDVADLPRPRVGYVGAIREWFDVELLGAAAERFSEASFVLVGDDTPRLQPLRRLRNVHVLGPRPYATLPGYLGALDVGLIPFHDTPLIRSTHPIKVYEYLAAGLPVVATPMRELEHLREVEIAERGEPFLEALGRRLREGRQPEADGRRRESVAEETWEARFRTVERVLGAALSRQRCVTVEG